ncbi:MAG: TonB family protein [Rhodobacteraceae bacterium]|nr:TonB family protein [Paracoccaceae bacterium]
MIRRSTAIAIAAILLSLLVHFVGLFFTSRIQPERSDLGTTNDVVALGNAFEDVAENLSEPVPPENTPKPEPQTEAVPEPELADTPTSEVLVASSNPQRTNSPDTGSAPVLQPDTTGPSELDQGRIPEPKTIKPSGSDQGTATNAKVTPPVVPDTVAQAPKGNPDAGAEPVETATAEPALRSPVAPVPQRRAALPVIPVPEPSPEDPETATAKDEPDGSDLAVATSLRPQLLERQPSTETIGQSDSSKEFSDLLTPPLIESPLTAYLRDGTDPKVQKDSGTQSGGLGFADSRGPGNSDVTNYAGLVLVHLNRAPSVHVSAQGSATVFFVINPDGTLGRIDIIDSSGSQAINRAAKAQIQSAAPFPRPPKGVRRRLSFIYWSN